MREMKNFRRNFSCPVIISRTEEKIGNSPGRPLGTLAKETFDSSVIAVLDQSPRPAVLIAELERLSPVKDLGRLLRSKTGACRGQFRGSDAFERHGNEWAGALAKDLNAIRILSQAGARADYSTREDQEVIGDLWRGAFKRLPRMVRWRGPNKEAEIFEATPPGAVLLSAMYGILRGRLRECIGCGKFMIAGQRGFLWKRCDDCKRKNDEFTKTKLGRRFRNIWNTTLALLRQGGYARLGIPTEFRKSYQQMLKRGFNQCTTEQEVLAWKRKVLPPPGRAGRPPGNKPRVIH